MARFLSSPGLQAGTSLASLLLRTAIRLDEPTVIKYLLMSRGDPEQAVRLRRFLLASSAYAICLPLVWLAYEFNLIAWGPAGVLTAVMGAVNLGLYVVFRTGLNRRFSDPSLTWVQVFIGNAEGMYAVSSVHQSRAVVLNLSLF